MGILNSVIYTKRSPLSSTRVNVEVDSYETDDPGETSDIWVVFCKNWESIAKKVKAINDNAGVKTFLNNSASQFIVLELSNL